MRTAGLLALLSAAISGCAQDGGSIECEPAPSFGGTPSESAIVGQTWWYQPKALYFCGIRMCGAIEPVELPAGAFIDLKTIYWNPAPEQAGRTHRFEIQTGEDSCGARAHQVWSVFVSAAPATG